MTQKTKYTIYSIIIFLSSSIYFFLAYIGYSQQHITLGDLRQYSGTVADVGTKVRHSSKNNATVFFINIQGLEETLGVYRMTQEYEDLLNEVTIGDNVTAFYLSRPDEDVNIDLIRIEKSGQIILSEDEWKKKESSLIYIGLIGGIFSVGLSIWYYRRYAK
jgi:hypothetical protein